MLAPITPTIFADIMEKKKEKNTVSMAPMGPAPIEGINQVNRKPNMAAANTHPIEGSSSSLLWDFETLPNPPIASLKELIIVGKI